MRTRIVIMLLVCLISVAAGAKRSTSRRSRGNAAQTPVVIQKDVKSIQVAPRVLALDDPAPPFFDVSVDWSLELTATEQALYQQMATDLCTVTALPTARTTFFSGITNFHMNTWTGMVQNVVTNGDGTYTVTVNVAPVLSYADGTETTYRVSSSGYTEQYTIDQTDVVTYVSSQDPLGMSGQAPLALMVD
jgi:hypothetical protein